MKIAGHISYRKIFLSRIFGKMEKMADILLVKKSLDKNLASFYKTIFHNKYRGNPLHKKGAPLKF